MTNALDLRPLLEMSVRVGADALLVQGPGGNVSLKRGDILWVKASGLWLAEALERQVFVPLSLAGVRARLASGDAEALSDAVLVSEAAPGLKPSIETALHALMPHAVVIHAHAVNSMTHAVLKDGRERVRAALNGDIQWAWVDYQRPGSPLAGAVAAALAQGAPDVLLLQNHGVVVGADTVAEAENLLREVERRLTLAPRALKSPPAAAGPADYAFDPILSGLATDSELVAFLTSAPLVPDQVVFMGGEVPLCEEGETIEAASRRIQHISGITPVLILQRDVGAFSLRSRSKGAISVVQGLFEIARRIPAGAGVLGLDRQAVADLMGWDAEHHRQALDRQRG